MDDENDHLKNICPDDSFCRRLPPEQISACEALEVKINVKELNVMNAKDHGETNDHAIVIEDLVAENAEEIKGGDAIYKMHKIGHTSADYHG